jgi:hypothetical protein
MRNAMKLGKGKRSGRIENVVTKDTDGSSENLQMMECFHKV